MTAADNLRRLPAAGLSLAAARNWVAGQAQSGGGR